MTCDPGNCGFSVHSMDITYFVCEFRRKGNKWPTFRGFFGGAGGLRYIYFTCIQGTLFPISIIYSEKN